MYSSLKEAQYTQTESLASHVQTRATEAAVTADSTAADSLWALIQVGLLKLQDSEAALALEDSTTRANLLAELQQLQNENDALESTEVWQWAERRYNEIALEWLSGAAPDSTDLSDLRAMAVSSIAKSSSGRKGPYVSPLSNGQMAFTSCDSPPPANPSFGLS